MLARIPAGSRLGAVPFAEKSRCSISVEASELLEHYQWAADTDVDRISAERRADIVDEIADIAILLTYLANDLAFDLSAIIESKLNRNAEKYPVAKSKGNSLKYDRL